jgi:hypothetical protein
VIAFPQPAALALLPRCESQAPQPPLPFRSRVSIFGESNNRAERYWGRPDFVSKILTIFERIREKSVTGTTLY